MSAASLAQVKPPGRQRGAVVAEFALVLVLMLLLMLMLMFGVIELARLMYMFNSIQMAARRAAHAAVNADFSDQAAIWRRCARRRSSGKAREACRSAPPSPMPTSASTTWRSCGAAMVRSRACRSRRPTCRPARPATDWCA
ncbi:hypothetical protein D0T21_20490 [Duganella sp. BJB476]|nr:hypothetical protein D0T21_20490 [Duganella sp. BJB476]